MDDLRKLQLIEVDILKEILRICNSHGLKCFLWYGTLLGAVRHNGFIPWDDDMDLALPEEDYYRFLDIAKNELDSKFFLHSIETDPNYFPAIARVRRNDTTLIPSSYKRTRFVNNGVWVDIYPLRYAKSDNSMLEKIKFHFIRKILRPITAVNALGVETNNSFKKVGARIIQEMNLKKIQKFCDKVESSCKKKDGSFYVSEGTSMNMHRYYYPIEYFGEGVIHDFEGVPCLIPVESDKLLRQIYGDYMQLPPEEERVGHLPTICDLSKVEVSE